MILDFKQLLKEQESLLLTYVEKGRQQVTEAQNRLDTVTENLKMQEANLKDIQDKIAEYEEFEKFSAAKNTPTETKKKTARKEAEVETEVK